MKRLKQRLSALAVVGALLGTSLAAGIAVPASANEGVVVVQSKSDAPETTVWSSGTPNPGTCMVTDTGVHTAPGQHHEAETELRYAYNQVIPGQSEVSHTEYKYQRTVADFKTQYFFAKFTHTKTRTWIEGTPGTPSLWANFSPNDYQGTFQGPPAYPTDPRGTWHVKGQVPGGHSGPDGVYQQGNGNGSWFYREAGTPGTDGYWTDWSAYGPWTLWTPVQHTSWQDSDAPLGSPEHHGSGNNFYREWQARATGETRQVPNGSHIETTEWVTAPPAGEGWTQIDSKKVVDSVQTEDKTVYYNPNGEPTETLTDANYTTGNPGAPWVKVDEKPFETKAAYTDPDVVTNYSHTYQSPDCTIPPLPANPNAAITAVCGSADAILTNPVVKDANQITASFVVFVDGEFDGAYAVEVGNREELSFEFSEDSGDHKIEVFQAGTSEWKLIAEATVPSDCVEPPVVVPPVETCTDFETQADAQAAFDSDPVKYAGLDGDKDGIACESATPPVVTPPVVEPPVEIAEGEAFLATTGGELPIWLAVGAVLALVAGGVVVLFSRRKKIDEATESVDAE